VNNKLVARILAIFILLSPAITYSQTPQADDEQEVLLSFRYKGVVSNYILSRYADDRFYLATSEIFSVLQIENRVDLQNLSVSGEYSDTGNFYEINFGNQTARIGDKTAELSPDDYLVRETDFFLHPSVFEELLDLEFTIDFNNLTLSLETPVTMPVVAERERDRRRERMLRSQSPLFRDFHPIRFDRKRQLFNAGFMDYNLSANVTDGTNVFVYNTNTGFEVAGGDFQGNFAGSVSDEITSFNTSNVRWRYVMRDNLYLTQATAGQSTSSGLLNRAFTGVKLSNEPIEPRFIFDNFVFRGETTPDSEVELYLNNSLVDYQRADGLGNYSFEVPLSYGSSQYDVRIFSPTGQVRQEFTRLQIPFNFLPPGEVNYNINAGRLDNPIFGTPDRGFMTQNNVRAGLTNWLTAGAGIEYFDKYNTTPTFTGSLSSRLLTKYLVTVEAANGAFVRFNTSAVFPSSSNFNLDYTYFLKEGGLYNPGRNKSTLSGSIFTPFEIGETPFFLRWSTNYQQRQTSNVTRYSFDLNTRLNRLNLRMGFRDSQIGKLRFEATRLGRISTSATYTLARHSGVPLYLRGAFIRSQINFLPSTSEFEEIELQFSRSIMRNGRIQLNAGRNFIGNFNLFSMNLTLDFNKARTNTTTRSIRGTTSISQSVRGSVGFDSKSQDFLLSNRQQVGRSGAAVRLFIDQNENGSFDDDDTLLPEQAARLSRAGGAQFVSKDITYFTQLLAYNRYNLEINKNALKDPLLVPALESFSIVTDPNQYKQIDIPMYLSGVLEGSVSRIDNTGKEGVGGLRLQIRGTTKSNESGTYQNELRTFSDGSFYTFELPPGDYEMRVDSTQLQFLGVRAEPEVMQFEIRALADGDIVEGQEILLYDIFEEDQFPSEIDSVQSEIQITESETETIYNPLPYIISDDSVYFDNNVNPFSKFDKESCSYTIQIGSFQTITYSVEIAGRAEDLTGRDFRVINNDKYNLNAIRLAESFTYSEATDLLPEISEALGMSGLAIVNHCVKDTDSSLSDPVKYFIEFGTFRNRTQAETFMAQILPDFTDSHLRIEEMENSEFAVVSETFESRKEAKKVYQLADKLPGSHKACIRITSGSKSDRNFKYLIQIGHFNDLTEAEDYIELFSIKFGYNTELYRDSKSDYYLVLSDTPEKWSELIILYQQVVSNSAFQKPVINLIEY
jgi:hypothetical protein